MDWIDYREELGIGFSDRDKVEHFMTKMFNILDDLGDESRMQISEDEYYTFCNVTGISMRHGDLYGEGYQIITNILRRNSHTLEHFLAYYVAFINCQKDSDYKTWTKENFKNVVCNILRESHIPYELVKDNEGYFIFPKGAEEMDTALVSQPLSWLSAYPRAHTAYAKALKEYSEATPDNASDIADKFRKTLETFFQEFFGCDKTLENCKGLYGGYLKSQNVPAEITANFETLLQAYTNYMNGYAKHHDKTGMNVLEYLMYQTGNIIRLLITLKTEESASSSETE